MNLSLTFEIMNVVSQRVFLFLYIAIAAFALYCYNPLSLYFQNDDFIHIPLSAAGKIFQRNSFRPVCDISVMIDYFIWKKNATGYHLSNLLLHIACCWLVFKTAKVVVIKYFEEANPVKTASLVTLLFFVYATHSEAVLWILGRSGILGLIFSLLFLLSYLKREQDFFAKVKTVILLLLALLSYESSFVLPLICLLLFFIDNIKEDWKNLLAVFITFLAYFFARIYVTGEILGSYEVSNLHQTAIVSIVQNFGKLFFRSFIPAYTQGIILVIACCIIAMYLLFLLIKKRTNKPLFLLFFIFIISLLPYCLLGIDAHGYESERYLYFPTFFLCLLIVLIIIKNVQKPLLSHALFLVILVIHSVSLFISSSNFILAGKVNKVIINGVNHLSGIDTLKIEQLPQAQNGALMMRLGFKEAIEWLGPKPTPEIIILSRKSEWETMQKNIKLKNNGSSFFHTNKTALFTCTNRSIIITFQ